MDEIRCDELSYLICEMASGGERSLEITIEKTQFAGVLLLRGEGWRSCSLCV